MEVRFGSVAKRKNSTATPNVSAVSINCHVKDVSSIKTPTLVVAQSDFNPSYNYAIIPAWGRRYFVSDYFVGTGSIVNVQLVEDIGGTWAGSIKGSTQFVSRSASDFNNMIADPYVNTTYAISTDSKYITLPKPYDGDGTYVLRTTSTDANASGGISTYLLSQTEMNSVLDYVFTQNTPTEEGARAIYNPFRYIISLMWLPLTKDSLEMGEAVTTVKYGTYDTGVKAAHMNRLRGAEILLYPVEMPSNIYSDWRAYDDSYSQYNIFLPGVGNVHVSASDIKGGLKINGRIDGITGQITWRIMDSDSRLISSHSGMYGVNIQLSQVGATFTSSMTAGLKKPAIPQLTEEANKPLSLMGTTFSDSLYKVTDYIEGSIQVASYALGNAVQKTNLINASKDDSPSTVGNMGNMADAIVNNQVVISLLNFGSTAFQTQTAGRPLYEYRTLSSLSGLCQCVNASLSLPGAYSEEEVAAEQLLNGGIYIE